MDKVIQNVTHHPSLFQTFKFLTSILQLAESSHTLKKEKMRSPVCLLMVLAMALSFSLTESAAVDIRETAFGVATGDKSSTPCCKQCVCQASVVAECRCTDVKAYCEKSCKSCVCTRSIPPQCRCMDLHRDDCYPPACKS